MSDAPDLTQRLELAVSELPNMNYSGGDVLWLMREAAAELSALRSALAEARMLCNGSCDIELACRQVGPDGDVPGNARECAQLWEREASRLWKALAAAQHRLDTEQQHRVEFDTVTRLEKALAEAQAERDALRTKVYGGGKE